jgi:hypothetical protein
VSPYKATDDDIYNAFLISLSSGSKMNSIFLLLGLSTQHPEDSFLFPFY